MLSLLFMICVFWIFGKLFIFGITRGLERFKIIIDGCALAGDSELGC